MVKKDKLMTLSKVTDGIDSVKASYSPCRTWDRAYDVLFEAQRYWDNMSDFRKSRERNKRYNYGDQWGDLIELKDNKCFRSKVITEEEYIREQGSEPLKNNLIRRLVKNVLGVYRSQSKEPTCTARDKDEQKYGETMSVVLQYNRQMNRMEELDARSMEEFLISGAAIQKSKWGWKRGRLDCFSSIVQPDCFFVDNNMRDLRGWDLSCIGEVHDISFGNLLENFAKNDEDVRKLREIYSQQAYRERIADNFQRFGRHEPRNIDFFNPSNPSLCRVIEVWRKETKARWRCHDFNNGDVYKIDLEDKQELVDDENADRLQRGLESGMPRNEIPMIKAEWFVDEYWYYYYLSPFGDILQEGETPYAHGEHPYTFVFYPFIDGEIHSFVEDVIDQQRYVNRLITLYDMLMRTSAKGMLLCPEDCLPDGMSWDDFAESWARVGNVVVYKPNNRKETPVQVTTNSTNIGIQDLLQYQLKFFEDISGVNGALQGKEGFAGTSGSLYAQQTQNATMSLLDLLETFSQFVIDCAYKTVKNIQQYYDTKRTFNIVGRAGQVCEYDPKKIRDVDFDLNISESTATPAYRQMANDFLMQLWNAQAITLEQLLQVGDFPFGDELLQAVKSQKQDMENGRVPQNISPELQKQVAQYSQSNPKAQAMLGQMMSGQGISPSEQLAPLNETV